MLGIVPEMRDLVVSSQSNDGRLSSDDEAIDDNYNKLSFMKRLRSFRKSTIRSAQGCEKNALTTQKNRSSLRDKLPAKYIQITNVKKATLNPVWMERFCL